MVHCPEQIELLEKVKRGAVRVWVKFDTGMNRLGFSPDDAEEILARISALKSVTDVRLMTHLSTADELDHDVTSDQIGRFLPLLENFDGAVSIANTPATLGWAEAIRPDRQNWIRPGIALFGISPYGDKTGTDLGLKPVMQFEARLIAIKPLRKGSRVGYKGAYESDSDTMLGIISAGIRGRILKALSHRNSGLAKRPSGNGHRQRVDGHDRCRSRNGPAGQGRRYRHFVGRWIYQWKRSPPGRTRFLTNWYAA